MGDICRDDILISITVLLFRLKKKISSLREVLLEKKRMTVPLNRVQSVRIIENPVRQLFGYAAVVIDSAGGGGVKVRKSIYFLL